MRLFRKKVNFKVRGVFLLISFLTLTSELFAQMEFPAGDFWSLDLGLGMSGLLVKGQSFQLIVDPKLWLSPHMMVGAKAGVNYSFEGDASNPTLGDILTFEGQVYLRWNFLRFGRRENPVNVFFVDTAQ